MNQGGQRGSTLISVILGMTVATTLTVGFVSAAAQVVRAAATSKGRTQAEMNARTGAQLVSSEIKSVLQSYQSTSWTDWQSFLTSTSGSSVGSTLPLLQQVANWYGAFVQSNSTSSPELTHWNYSIVPQAQSNASGYSVTYQVAVEGWVTDQNYKSPVLLNSSLSVVVQGKTTLANEAVASSNNLYVMGPVTLWGDSQVAKSVYVSPFQFSLNYQPSDVGDCWFTGGGSGAITSAFVSLPGTLEYGSGLFKFDQYATQGWSVQCAGSKKQTSAVPPVATTASAVFSQPQNVGQLTTTFAPIDVGGILTQAQANLQEEVQENKATDVPVEKPGNLLSLLLSFLAQIGDEIFGDDPPGADVLSIGTTPINSDTVVDGDLVIPSWSTLNLKGALYVKGTIYNFGSITGTGTIYCNNHIVSLGGLGTGSNDHLRVYAGELSAISNLLAGGSSTFHDQILCGDTLILASSLNSNLTLSGGVYGTNVYLENGLVGKSASLTIQPDSWFSQNTVPGDLAQNTQLSVSWLQVPQVVSSTSSLGSVVWQPNSSMPS